MMQETESLGNPIVNDEVYDEDGDGEVEGGEEETEELVENNNVKKRKAAKQRTTRSVKK